MSTEIKNMLLIRREENGSLTLLLHDGPIASNVIISTASIAPGETWIPPNDWRTADVRPDMNASVSIETDSGGYISSIKNTEPQAMETEAKIELIKKLLEELPSDEDRLNAMDDICKYCGSVGDGSRCMCMRDD